MKRLLSVEEHTKSLNCHFNWDLDKSHKYSNVSCKVDELEEKLMTDINGNPPIACKGYLLLAFTYTVGDISSKIDYDKALEFIEKASKTAKSEGEKYLAIANEFCIFKAKRDPKANRRLIQDIKDREALLTNEDLSDICIAEAFSLSRFSMPGYEHALKKYEQATEFDSKNGEGHFGVGLMKGRLRRAVKGPVSKPREDELNAFRRAMIEWKGNPLPVVFYALALSDRLFYDSAQTVVITINEMDRYLSNAMKKASSFGQGSSIVYKLCAKGYRRICGVRKLPKQWYLKYISREEECIEKAVELSPNDSSICHEAALFYWKTKAKQDLEKAEYFLIRASECSLFKSNVWADIHIVEFSKKHKKGYDALAGYSKLLAKYAARENYLPYIYEHIAAEYYHAKDLENARIEYYQALLACPDCSRLKTTEQRLPRLTQLHVEHSRDLYVSDPGNASQYIETLYEAANIYETFEPKKLLEAKKVYDLILKVDEMETEAKLRLMKVLLGLGFNDQCIELAFQVEDDAKNEALSEAYFNKAIGSKDFSNMSYTRLKERGKGIPMPKSAPPFQFPRASPEQTASSRAVDPYKPTVCEVKMPKYISYFLFSANYGSSQGAVEYIKALSTEILPIYAAYVRSMDIYENFASIECATDGEEEVSSLIQSALKLNDLESPLVLVKKSRYKMTLTRMNGDSNFEVDAASTVQEAKNSLDRTFAEFVKSNFDRSPQSKTKSLQYYFPYLKRKDKTGKKLGKKTEKNFIDSRRLLSEKIERNLEIEEFIDLFPDLLQFLSYRTPVYDAEYAFVPEFCEQVNRHKHEADITRAGNTVVYGLAHRAAEFAEEVVQELSKYIK